MLLDIGSKVGETSTEAGKSGSLKSLPCLHAILGKVSKIRIEPESIGSKC